MLWKTPLNEYYSLCSSIKKKQNKLLLFFYVFTISKNVHYSSHNVEQFLQEVKVHLCQLHCETSIMCPSVVRSVTNVDNKTEWWSTDLIVTRKFFQKQEKQIQIVNSKPDNRTLTMDCSWKFEKKKLEV